MEAAKNAFYSQAVMIGVHQFVEFAGFMSEYIKLAREAHREGKSIYDVLPIKPHHAAYVADKLGCIYGPVLFASQEVRDAFIEELFQGQCDLVVRKQDEPGSDYAMQDVTEEYFKKDP
jgi:hypothetical protein